MVKAKVGDLVRVTHASISDRYTVGNLAEVTYEYPWGVEVQFDFGVTHKSVLEHGHYEIVPQSPPKDFAEPVTQADAVNSPPHYTQGKHEVIDIIEFITEGYDDSFVGYCVGNTVKYVARAPFKHGSPAEDLRKAAWYLTKAADYIEKDAR